MTIDAMQNGSILTAYPDNFLPVYAQECGESSFYEEVGQGFETYLTEKGDNYILKDPVRHKKEAANRFRNYLKAGNCYEPPTNIAQEILLKEEAAKTAQEIGRQNLHPIVRQQIWHNFTKQYSELINRLYIILPSHKRKSVSGKLMQAITGTVETSEAFATEFDDELEKYYWSFDPTSRVIIGAQRGMIKDIRSLAKSFLSSNRSNSNKFDFRQIKDFIEPFKRSWREFNDPLAWLSKAYINMDVMIKIFAMNISTTQRTHIYTSNDGRTITSKDSITEFGARVAAFKGTRPILPTQPHLIRRALDSIVLVAALIGNDSKPVSISFSLNDKKDAIVITSLRLDAVIKNVNWETAIIPMIKQLGQGREIVDADRKEIHIPLYQIRNNQPPTSSTDPSRNTNSTNGNDSSTINHFATINGSQMGAFPFSTSAHYFTGKRPILYPAQQGLIFGRQLYGRGFIHMPRMIPRMAFMAR